MNTRMFQPFIDALALGQICDDEIDCDAYALSAPFVNYVPFNPFTGGDPPDGYVSPPFVIHDGGSTMPPAYKAGDILVPFQAINFIDYTIFGQPITIEIELTGSGQVELDLLSVVQGGVAVLKVGDNPPNALDIISGIIDPSTETIIDLSLDQSQAPPVDDIVSAQEINIEQASGETTTLFIQFLPVVDLDIIPIKFGGGIRSIQLCGFENEAGIVGIETMRFNPTECVFEMLIDSVWYPVPNFDPECFRGADGADGVDGADGADGVDGADGADGADGVDGADGADGGNLNFETQTIRAWQEIVELGDVWETDVSDVVIDLTQVTDDRIMIEAILYSTSSAKQSANLLANGNSLLSAYQRKPFDYSSTIGNPRVLSLSPTSFDGVTKSITRLEIDGLLSNSKPLIRVEQYFPAHATSNNMTATSGAWFYEVQEALDDLTISPLSGDIKAFGSYKIYALRDVDVLASVLPPDPDPDPDPDPSPEPDWWVDLDIDGFGYTDGVLDALVPVGSGASWNVCCQDNGSLLYRLTMGESARITRVQQFYSTNDARPDIIMGFRMLSPTEVVDDDVPHSSTAGHSVTYNVDRTASSIDFEYL